MAQKRVLRLQREALTALHDDELGAVAAGADAKTVPVTVCYLYQCPGTFAAGCQIEGATTRCGA